MRAHNTSTIWKVMPSFKYDALCFLNILTGDTFYTKHYPQEYNQFSSLLNDASLKLISRLKKVIKDDGGGILSAWLCLYFSASSAETLDEMKAAALNPEEIKNNMMDSPYYNEEGWKMFESIQHELAESFEILRNIQFENYWRENIYSKVSSYSEITLNEAGKHNVVKEVESALGRKLESNIISVYMLYFARPHGIKITGTRFITDTSYTIDVTIRTAVHEMMHPPYSCDDSALKELLSIFKKDEFVMDKVNNHNPSFGYNTFEGYIEENIVQALDQVINEKLGIANDARLRWKQNDDGMHVLAAALYYLMKIEKYNGEFPISELLTNLINSNKLYPGNVQNSYNNFYSAS